MSDCIFCKIVEKEIPSTIVFEDADVLAFMDIGPIVKGHALVIPKQHHDPVTETPDEVLAKLFLTAKKIAKAQMNAFGAQGVNIMQNNGRAAGQEVEHIHVHVIPRFEEDGHHWNWNPKRYDDFDEMAKLADQLREQL
ncbi:Purine nucleoside phosphoramidase [Pontiella desulfatans]|uniref:Purine nucleoside phosphoramidase n=2 Tax=Pontiella desulfatans TaxID=2750659 RepID=A0A6C2UAU1_PONDE|nr:Purine nucleoside phosphoramidase [Pontiella desulfatans]